MRKLLQENQCRRCGHMHDEAWQLVDDGGRWALAVTECHCGHQWTVLHTAPANLALLKGWLARGCKPPEGPYGTVTGSPWHAYRLEGIRPDALPQAV